MLRENGKYELNWAKYPVNYQIYSLERGSDPSWISTLKRPYNGRKSSFKPRISFEV